MDESALRILIANLDVSRSSFHWWLEFFTALVVAGVVLEVVFVVWEYREDLHDFRRGIVHPPNKPSVLLLVFGLFGASLVAIGVAGEFREEAKIEGVETQIRKANDELYILLSKEAGDAAVSAKTAHVEADAVKSIADEARADARDALVKAQAAQHSLAQAEGDAAEAQAVATNSLKLAQSAEAHLKDALDRAEKAEQEIARVKEPRRLNLEQQKRIADKLSRFAGQKFAFIVFGDSESLDLLQDINRSLRLAKWVRVEVPESLGLDVAFTVEGIRVPQVTAVGCKTYVSPEDAVGNIGGSADVSIALALAINAEGVPCEPHMNARMKGITNLIVIQVGQKKI
jgi:hypothetical protein